MAEHGPGHEAEEVKEVIWTYTGWAVVLLICVGAGVFIGWSLWGDATNLRAELNTKTEEVNTLKNERETLKSQLALASRDKDECNKRLSASQAAGRAAPAPAPGSPMGGAGMGGGAPGAP